MSTILPTFSEGNTKLGKCIILSRAVGDTCSPDCPNYGKACYARATERRFADARRCGLENANVRTPQIVSLLGLARAKERAVRLHERGDFGNGRVQQIDKRYVGAIERGMQRLGHAVRVWTYTHIYRRRLARLAKLGLSIYASIHGRETLDKARAAGFTRFALQLPQRPHKVKPQRRALPEYTGPQAFERFGERFIVCPAQYNVRGNALITCERCGICPDGRSSVAFLTH